MIIDKDIKKEFLSEDPKTALYNLPHKVEYCKVCAISNQRPDTCAEHNNTSDQKKSSIRFDKDGICNACNWIKKKETIDWDKRENELKDLCDKYRSRNGSYDVVVPGSGGKDSFFTSHILKTKYNMNPITCTFSPHIYTDWGKNNFYNWIDAGHSNYLFTADNKIHRLMTRLSLENILHPFQPWVLGHMNFPIKFAAMMKIPFMMYGDNSVEFGTAHDSEDENLASTLYSCENTDDIYLGGYHIAKLKKDLKLSNAQLEPYVPINTKTFKEAKIKYCTISYFLKWSNQEHYYYTMENSQNFQLSPERTSGTYTKHQGLDDKLDDLHYYTSMIKFGLGRGLYDAANDVRHQDITREEGVKLAQKYQEEYPKRFMKEFCEYLTINPNELPGARNFIEKPIFTESYFNELCDKFRSPHIWKLKDNKWELRNPVK